MRKIHALSGWFPYRCTHRPCRFRKTFYKDPSARKKDVKCPMCEDGRMLLDNYLKNNKDKSRSGKTCECDGAHYPHRAGSIADCKHYFERMVGTCLAGTRPKDPSPDEPPF